ncbi:hypothetical protein F383_28078 [Gossypium arboreum]|uniref:Uncharacterized protein n=1 Tax=Gossypium arboreum TaxID=29729 RepID=A0A0B0P9P6_GOSAR|nr:hypothetical protein F383_28078 [Gossypium arboreum]
MTHARVSTRVDENWPFKADFLTLLMFSCTNHIYTLIKSNQSTI